MTERSTRRGALGRGLAVLAGLAGLGAAGGAEANAAATTTIHLYGRGWRSHSRDRRPGELPRQGDRLTFHGELHDRSGARVGELNAAAFSLRGPGSEGAARMELHTFDLDDGSIIGSGTTGAGEGPFAILGGTGRYAGARGTYVARQAHHELGGDGTAEFVLTLFR